jgi:hypothetical protein
VPPPAPIDEYRSRLAARQDAIRVLDASDARLAGARLAVFAAGAAAVALAWGGAIGWVWLLGPALAFGVLVWRHDQVLRVRAAARRAARFYERGLARIEDRWRGATGETGVRFRDAGHLYADDLDLFGVGSVFELLSIARTRGGEARLAAWLWAPAAPDAIRGRQQAAGVLAPRLDLREALARADTAVGDEVPDDGLVAWAREAASLGAGWVRPAARALTTAVVASGAWWAATGEVALFLLVLGVQLAFALPLRRRIQRVLHAASTPSRELDAVGAVLARLESETFETPRLAALQRRLAAGGSAAIRRLHRLVEYHDWQHNQFFAPLGALLLWGTHVACAIDAWRGAHGPGVAGWLDAVADLDALDSIAAYRYEHPDDAWPEIVDGGAPLVEATNLTHPLLPRARAVANDVTLGAGADLLIISGSNMSGKSTLLRTVGVNVVLALAGAPVRAAALRVSPLAIGATLRIQDSLQEGRSRFYAEITRVRAVVEAGVGTLPLLFLFDEIFQGTNSHDRLAGATGVLRSLLARPALGLVTTHDLALTGAADALGGRVANVHFEDRLEGDALVFDYRMRPGPVERGNGVALMRAVGLDVDAADARLGHHAGGPDSAV